MKTVEWNINNYVTVELCEYGVEVYEKHLLEFYNVVCKNGAVQNLVNDKMDELKNNNHKLRLQGWDMMQIFGNELRLGSRPSFHKCVWNVEVDE